MTLSLQIDGKLWTVYELLTKITFIDENKIQIGSLRV
jgi:hypothetical protein